MASDQQFCLRWNNHQSTLVSVFDNLLESQTLVDCTLAADGQYLKAHKVVLSACSPYLEAILCQNLDKHPILILKDVKYSELKAMIDYMYRGEVNISQEQLSTFLKAAESLQIKGLTDSGGGGGGGNSEPRERDLLKRQDLRKPLNQPVPHIPQPRPVVPHPGLLEPRRSLPHFPPHIADMQPQSPRHAREGSTSPTARKRRRPNRPSSDDSNFVSTPNSLSENQPDTSDSCDVPVKQSAPSTPSNVPNPSTKAQETDSPRTTPQPQINSDQKQIVVKKEFPESLLTPKTELDYGNDNSMEDVNYEDDEDEEVDLSKPGTSFATNNQGFPPWQMGGDASNDDSNIYSPEVSASATQNNSQGYKKKSTSPEISWTALPKRRSMNQDKHKQPIHIKNCIAQKVNNYFPGQGKAEIIKTNIVDNLKQSNRIQCVKCKEFIHINSSRLHSKYFCGTQPGQKEWKLNGCMGVCLSCNKTMNSNVIEFHVKYLCGKKPITVQCFYCPNFYVDYRKLLKHMLLMHKKRHRYLDLMSILPPADPIMAKNKPAKVVRHFFNNTLSGEGKIICEKNGKTDNCLQVRQKTTYSCQSCGKGLKGIHAYQNHVNTKCESEKHYSCFFCSFKADFAYEVLEHMEGHHNQQFNTYDIIQANLTGIIPTVDIASADSLCEDVEVTFAMPEFLQPSTLKLVDEENNKDLVRNGSPIKRTLDKHSDIQDHLGAQKRTVRANVKLAVAKRKVYIRKKVGDYRSKKYNKVTRIKCPKCLEEVHSTEKRIHTRYHCGKDHEKNEWILKNGRALCLRCKKIQMSNLIDFHVKYACSTRKKTFLVQCFYCTNIFKDYRNLTAHMKKSHNKSHYYADLLTILPDPDTIKQEELNTKIVIKHPSIYVPEIKTDESGNPTIVKFPISEDFHACFDCAFKSQAGYKVIDHMQEVHGKNYSLYDLLQAKMIGNAKNT